jgi:signal transduction histidine kinase
MQTTADIYSLAVHIPPFAPTDTINEIAAQMLRPEYQSVLSVPVVADDMPVGIISRYQLNEIFMKKFGRDLFGERPVATFMKRDFMAVEVGQPVSEAAQYIATHMTLPLSEDFVITEQGRYIGLGAVLGLLGAMERQLKKSATDLSRAYGELKASQARLVQSEKMASLGQMVAGVAHEINTPLGYVHNNVEMVREFAVGAQQLVAVHQELVALLLAPGSSDMDIARQLAAIDDLQARHDPGLIFPEMDTALGDTVYGLEQISHLVMGLKNFSRLDQAPTDNVSLNECMDSSLLIARSVFKSRVQVVKQYSELPPVSCAPSQINQVLLNLLTNAAQAITGEGVILVKTWADVRAAYVSVQDSGKGIAPEHLKKIFDPFFTTKPVGEGTGLGLSIAFQIIERHGGSIRVASEPGRGTRFVIALPRPGKTLVVTAPRAEAALP